MPHLVFLGGPQGQVLMIKFLMPEGHSLSIASKFSQSQKQRWKPETVPGCACSLTLPGQGDGWHHLKHIRDLANFARVWMTVFNHPEMLLDSL